MCTNVSKKCSCQVISQNAMQVAYISIIHCSLSVIILLTCCQKEVLKACILGYYPPPSRNEHYLASDPGLEHFLAKDPPLGISSLGFPPKTGACYALWSPFLWFIYQREVYNRYSNCLFVCSCLCAIHTTGSISFLDGSYWPKLIDFVTRFSQTFSMDRDEGTQYGLVQFAV